MRHNFCSCGVQPTAKSCESLVDRRYPKRKQPYRQFFTKLESRLRKKWAI